MLDKNFLSDYYKAGDPFKSLLSRSIYLGKYRRLEDSCWTDTIARVVRGSVALDPTVTKTEAEALFDTFWRMKALPPGRGLWSGGVENFPVEGFYNCHATSLRTYEDWCWTANMLMCGGGVGVGLTGIDQMQAVVPSKSRLAILCSHAHPNRGEVMPDDIQVDGGTSVVVDDSRGGWVDALRSTFFAAWFGMNLTVNVSSIRARGAPIKTFGGVACGPGPLATLLRQVWSIVRGAAGRKLTSVECLDITNHIGVCIKSGNVRRSALIVLGKADDQSFRDAKKDWQAVMAHRHSSNNSIVFETEEQIRNFDWTALVEDASIYGEPGILNLAKIRETDPFATGVNPCGEIPLHDREACCLSEVYPALAMTGSTPLRELERVLRLTTRYTLRQRLRPMVDFEADEVRIRNMRIGVGLGGICDFNAAPWFLSDMHDCVRGEADTYARYLKVARPVAVTTVKPSGTISKLNGSSPGNHAPYADFWLQRTRIGVDEPMAAALMEAGVPHEPCVYDKTGKTLVFAFPMKAPKHGGTTVQNERVYDQVQRQVKVQREWADNAVSSTISFAEHEKVDLAYALKVHIGDLKSISILPKKHGYSQAPYEEIAPRQYMDLCAGINHVHPLTVGGDLEIEECEGGVCPVK